MPVPHCLEGLRPVRKLRKVSPADLAEIIGLKPTSYSRFERGERRIYLDQARTLAHRLGVRVDDLLDPLTEDQAAALCDRRDKEAIAAGTFDQRLWAPGAPRASVQVPPPPSAVPPPPPPEVNARADDAGVEALLGPDWSDE